MDQKSCARSGLQIYSWVVSLFCTSGVDQRTLVVTMVRTLGLERDVDAGMLMPKPYTRIRPH